MSLEEDNCELTIINKEKLIKVVAGSFRTAKRAHGGKTGSSSIVKRVACDVYGHLLSKSAQIMEEIPKAKMRDLQKENIRLQEKIATQAKVIKDLLEKCKKTGAIA